MIDYETFMQIKTCHEHKGLTCPQIARAWHYLVNPTIKNDIAHEIIPAKQQARSIQRPYHSLLETHSYSATQIFPRPGRKLLHRKRICAKDKPRKVEPFLKLSFAPGECAQVDWGPRLSQCRIHQPQTQPLSWCCYSRMMYVEFTVSKPWSIFPTCHQNLLTDWGPKKITVDNLKSAVLNRILGQNPVLNPNIWTSPITTVSITPCAVRKGNEKAV